MENQPNSSKQIMLNYGLFLGLASVMVGAIIYAMGKIYEFAMVTGIVGLLLIVVFIILGILKYKQSNGGFLSLSEALKIGLGIALIGGLISVIYNYLFATFIEPDFIKNMTEIQIDKIIESRPSLTEDQIDAIRATEPKGPFFNASMGIIFSLFIGFIVALIGGLIMKKTDEEITSI